MSDRFRLLYLKSTGEEKPGSSEPSTYRDPSSQPALNSSFKTLSSQVVFKQAKTDLKHPSSRIRILAVRYLGQCDFSTAVPLIQEALSDHDPDVRAEGLHSLMKFQEPVVGLLFKKYLKDSDPKVRLTALRGIFNNGGRIDLNIILQLLSDDSPRVRRKVAALLGWTRMEGALPALAELSKDEDPQVRKAALSSLIALYPEESEDRMLEAMTDTDADLRRWAREVLEKMLDTAQPLREGRPI